MITGLLITIGLFTRPAAFIASGTMAVAYWMAHAPQGFWPALNQGELYGVVHAVDGVEFVRILRIYEIIFQRQPKPEEIQMGVAFLTAENKAQTALVTEMKDSVAKAQEAVEKKYQDMMGRNDGAKAIQNKGKLVERRPLTPYETYAHALLLSNEASYIN